MPTPSESVHASRPDMRLRKRTCSPGASMTGQARELVTMTAEPLDSPVTEAVRTLEVRWIFPGQLATAVAGWFARFPATVEAREDAYLLDPQLRGLSVKVRGGRALEVKVYLAVGESSTWPDAPAGACRTGRSGPSPAAR